MEGAASERWILCMSGEMAGNYGWTEERKQAWGSELCVLKGEVERELQMFMGHCMDLLS